MVEDAIRHPSQFSPKIETVKEEEDEPGRVDVHHDALDVFGEGHVNVSASDPSPGEVTNNNQDESATFSNDETDEDKQH